MILIEYLSNFTPEIYMFFSWFIFFFMKLVINQKIRPIGSLIAGLSALGFMIVTSPTYVFAASFIIILIVIYDIYYEKEMENDTK